MIRFRPDIVFLTLSGNDIHSKSEPKQIAENVLAFVRTLKTNKMTCENSEDGKKACIEDLACFKGMCMWSVSCFFVVVFFFSKRIIAVLTPRIPSLGILFEVAKCSLCILLEKNKVLD